MLARSNIHGILAEFKITVTHTPSKFCDQILKLFRSAINIKRLTIYACCNLYSNDNDKGVMQFFI